VKKWLELEVGWADFMGYVMGYDGIYHGMFNGKYHGISLVYDLLNNGLR
jgi:hypothetical protein